MPTLRKRFGYFLPAYTLLACALGINCHELHASFLGFALQHAQEAAPGDIADCPSQSAVPEHPTDIQAFDSNQAISKDQFQSYLVMMLAPKVADASVDFLDTTNSLPPVASTLFLSTDSTTRAAQSGQSILEITRIWFLLALTRSEKRFQPHVDTNGGLAVVHDWHVWQFAGEDGVPLARFALNRHGFDFSLNGPMQLDASHANVLNAETFADKPNAVAVSGESEAIESVPPLKARITQLLAVLDPAKEVFKRPLQPTHCRLRGREVESSEERIREPFVLEPCRLFCVLNRSFFGFIGVIPLFQASVVETPMRFEHDAQFAFLISVCPQAIAESASHDEKILRYRNSFFKVSRGRCGNPSAN